MHSKDEEKEEYKKKQRERWTASAPTFVHRKNGWTAHSGQDGGLDESGEPNQEVAVATEAADTEKEATKTQRQQRTQRPQRPRIRKKRPQRTQRQPVLNSLLTISELFVCLKYYSVSVHKI